MQFFENDIFDCRILWMVGEDEWILLVSSLCDVSSAVSRSISWARCLPVCCRRCCAFFEKKWHISSHLLLKSESSLQRRLSLRN